MTQKSLCDPDYRACLQPSCEAGNLEQTPADCVASIGAICGRKAYPMTPWMSGLALVLGSFLFILIIVAAILFFASRD